MTARIGIDGRQLAGALPHDPCCPPSVCSIDDCSFICNFVQAALPDGPLWDHAKHAYNAAHPGDCLVDAGTCSDLVAYAAFVAKVTLYFVREAVWPMVREASPFTAWTTRQAWLDRWGWTDCFLDPNRSEALGEITPYEVIAAQLCEEIEEQGSQGIVLSSKPLRVLSPPTIPTPLQDAVTHGLIKALARRSLGPVPTLDSLNCIIEPLGAVLSVDTPFDVWSAIDARSKAFCEVVNTITGAVTQSPAGLAVEDDEEQGTGAGFDLITGPFTRYCRGASANCFDPPQIVNADDEQGQGEGGCCIFDVPVSMMIGPSTDFIARGGEAECPRTTPFDAPRSSGACGAPGDCDYIPAFFEPCDAARPARIYPGVLAAECIVRSILPDTMSYTLRRCEDRVYVRPCS